jgi:uncharacterized protein YfiM (DUF2279 family)
MRSFHAIALLAACAAAADPCLAAGLDATVGPQRSAIGAFAGMKVAMPFGGRGTRSPRARLQVGSSYATVDSASGAPMGVRTGAGIELGLGRHGTLAWSIAGRDAPQLKRQLGFKGSTPYIVVGGVVLLVALLAAIASASPKPGSRPGDFGP